MQCGHCLHKNVALGILFISIIVLEEEERQINMQSLSAHVAFYELMPLQECFEETTIFVCFVVFCFFSPFFQATSFQPPVKQEEL